MPETRTLTVQRGVFDLATMNEITLVKKPLFTDVESTAQALERLGGDTAKFLKVINDGLRAEVMRSAVVDSSLPWMVEDDEGKLSEFVGKPADSKKVNALVLNFAKMDDRYAGGGQGRKDCKTEAFEFVKTSPAIVEKLQKSAGITADSEE